MSQLHKSWLDTEARRAFSVDLPAQWASALVNGDTSGLSLRPTDTEEFDVWAAHHPDLLDPVTCSDEPFIGRWDELTREMLTYTYITKGENK